MVVNPRRGTEDVGIVLNGSKRDGIGANNERIISTILCVAPIENNGRGLSEISPTKDFGPKVAGQITRIVVLLAGNG